MFYQSEVSITNSFFYYNFAPQGSLAFIQDSSKMIVEDSTVISALFSTNLLSLQENYNKVTEFQNTKFYLYDFSSVISLETIINLD